jgi:hypothetical protein
MILDRLIDKIGDWNPQIFRELKQRLTSKNLGLAAGVSALSQGFVWFYFNNQLPIIDPRSKELLPNSNYCLPSNIKPTPEDYSSIASRCRLDAIGNPMVNWQQWWSDMFTALSWMLPLALILGTVYLLVADLVQEEKRGTLNFIRLSPQSAQKIFIGKILGVPSLVYLAVALMVPFHLGAGMTAGASMSLLSGWYLTIGAIWLLLSSAAVTYVLLGGVQAILTVVAVTYPVGLPLVAINYHTKKTIDLDRDYLASALENTIRWFWIPISSTALWVDAFIIGGCVVATYWVWQALERRYLNPTATAIGKLQSYQINLCLSVFLAGFAIPPAVDDRYHYHYQQIVILTIVCHFIILFLQIPALLPSKQVLQDWSRYRREGVTFNQRKFWQDLVFNDKSPALLAIAINLVMAMVLWFPLSWISNISNGYKMKTIAALALGTSLMLIYAAIAHLSLFINFKQRNIALVAILGATMCLPIAVAYIMSGNQTPTGIAGIILLFSPFASASIFTLSATTVFAAFATQLAIFGVLTHSFQRKLQIIGRSQMKELLEPIQG